LSPSVKVVLRFLWFFLTRLVICGLIVGLVALAFFAAMDYMSIQTLVKDGLQARAEVVIKEEDPSLLSKVFSRSFLEQDALLKSTAYQPFNVSDYDYKAEIGMALVLPWQNSVTLRVTEEVTDIDAELYETSEEEETTDTALPYWDNGIYDVKLTRYEDSWRIVSMELVELLPKPTPTPEPSVTPTPSPTPSPTPENPEDIIED
jgi:hypothetical protein